MPKTKGTPTATEHVRALSAKFAAAKIPPLVATGTCRTIVTIPVLLAILGKAAIGAQEESENEEWDDTKA